VAAIIERNGKFLFVEELTERGVLLNQPAGHLEMDESLLEAASRETLEETAHIFTAHALLGVYQYRNSHRATYLRFAFIGDVGERDQNRALDADILRTVWLTAAEIRACSGRHRSPLVMHCVDDYLAGRRFALDLIHRYV
jgi:8-oxo-dGTP pyrophosphatase MutT (NUDIX family)